MNVHDSRDGALEELLVEPNGYWHTLKSIRYADLKLVNAVDGTLAATLTRRVGALRVWWDNGPQYYVAVYAHETTSTSAETDDLRIELLLKNAGGGTEKRETVNDRVGCRDVARRTVWSFSITEGMAEHIVASTAELAAPVSWTYCV